jgi:hypothetical protein
VSPRAGGGVGAGRAAALVVVLVLTGCGGGGGTATSPAAAEPLPSGPLAQPADLDELLPGLAADASLRPRWETRDQLWELSLLRGPCGGDPDTASPSSPGAGSPEHEAEQWWQGTQPQHATLDVLRWPASEPDAPEAWVEGVVTAESVCPEALVLPHQPGPDGGPEVEAVVRRWEQPVSAGGPGTAPLPLWQVGAFAVDGSTAVVVRVGAYSAPTAQEAWVRARRGTTAVVALAAQRAAAPAPAPPSS